MSLNVPDDPSLVLWSDRDPNLYRVGIYDFDVEATKLRQALQAVVLPTRQAPFLTIEVSTFALKIIAQTADASFVMATSTPLLRPTEIGSAPIRFEVDREVMMRVAGLKDSTGPLAFTFDRSASSLAWTAHEGQRSICITARGLPSAAPEAGLRPLAMISRRVAPGIRFAAALINRKESISAYFPYDGVLIENGSAFGGYSCGASRYRSPLLPENLALSVPKIHVANARALCSRLVGEAEVSETDARIYLKAVNIEGSWTRIQQRSAGPLNRMFEEPPVQTIRVSSCRLQAEAYLMAEFFEELRMTIEERGADARVVFTGSSKIGRGRATLLEGRIERPRADDQPPWHLMIHAKDLRDAVSAIYRSSATTFLSVIKQGLLIRSEADEAEYTTILLGHERQ